MESIIALGLIAICATSVLGPRLNVAAPLLLVAVGIAVGFIPGVPLIHIEPDWVLAGLLPPLLYSAAVSMPAMDFRREFAPIAGLSVLLVVLSSVGLGFLLWAVIEDLTLPWAIALGAVLSPTDAVATSIVKKTGISPRIISILEGEGLLNDATALVMLRTAVAATAASVSLWQVAGSVVYSVVVAAAIGLVVGKSNLWIRSRISAPTATTALSFAVPFIAMIPAEALNASGLVAAVVAGLITGQGAARYFSPMQRISDSQNWATIEFVLEGAIFLTMGLQFHTLLEDLPDESVAVVLQAGGIALLALLGSVILRAGFVAPLLMLLHRRAARRKVLKPKLEKVQEVLSRDDIEDIMDQMRQTGEVPESIENEKTRAAMQARLERINAEHARLGAKARRRRFGRVPSIEDVRVRLRRSLADIDYFLASPLTWRDGTVVVWAGMRGAITVAAAQTLPLSAPQRSYLILIAFLVAGFSLLIQGGTLRGFVKVVKPTPGPSEEDVRAEQQELSELMDRAAREFMDSLEEVDPVSVFARLGAVEARREALLEARDEGIFDAAILSRSLDVLDAEQIALELRADGREP